MTALTGAIFAGSTNVTFTTSSGAPEPTPWGAAFGSAVGSNCTISNNLTNPYFYGGALNNYNTIGFDQVPDGSYVGYSQTLSSPLSYPLMVQEKIVVYNGASVSFSPITLSTASGDPFAGSNVQSTLAVTINSKNLNFPANPIYVVAQFKTISNTLPTNISPQITIPSTLISVQKNATFVVRLEMFSATNGLVSVLDSNSTNVITSQCITASGLPTTGFSYFGASTYSSGGNFRNFSGAISNISYSTSTVTAPVAVPTVTPATQTLCSNGAIQPFVAKSATASATYTWSDGTAGTSLSPAIAALNGTTIYTVTANACGAPSSTATASLTVNPAPTPIVLGSTFSICTGGSVLIQAVGSALNSNAWSPTTGLSSTSKGEVAAPTTSTTYTLTTTTTKTGCKSSTTVSVAVNPYPSPVAGTSTTVCSGKQVSLGSAGVAADSYSWSPSTGLSNVTISNPVLTSTATTTYTVTETTSAGCSKTSSVTITTNPTPAVPTISGVSSVCVGSIVELTASATGGTWSIADATKASITSSSAGNNVFVTGVAQTGATADAITYTESNSYGCSSSATLAMTVNDVIAPFVIDGPSLVCPGTTPSYTVAINNVPVTTNVAGVNYTWNIQNDGQIATYFPVNGSFQTQLSIPQSNSTNNFVLRCVGSNQCGNSTMATLPITINSGSNVPPVPAITCTGGTGCPNLTLTNAGSNSISWSSGETTTTINRTPATYYEVIYTNTSSGCTNYAWYSPEVVCTYQDVLYTKDEALKNTPVIPGRLPDDFKLNVYPNPSQGNIQFESNGYVGLGIIYDAMGNQIQTIQLTENSSHQEISLTGKVPGIYFLKLAGGAKQYSATFVVQ